MMEMDISYLQPSLTLKEIEGFSLPEIEKRVNYILEAKKNEQTHHLRDLSSIIYYAVGFGYSTVKAKKGTNLEQKFHKVIDKLLKPNQQTEPQEGQDPFDALSSTFGQ